MICLFFRHVFYSSTQSPRTVHSFLQCCCSKQPEEQCALLGKREMWWSNADKRGAFSLPQHLPVLSRAARALLRSLHLSVSSPGSQWSFQVRFFSESWNALWEEGRCPDLSEWHCCMCTSAVTRLSVFFREFGFSFFFLNSWESLQLWNFPCIWRCTSPHSYFQHLTSTKISEVF